MHFSSRYNQVIIEIDGEDAFVDFTHFPSFWNNCTEIRVAKNKSGDNLLKKFIEKHELLPPQHPRNKGDKQIGLKVIEPYHRFQLFVEYKNNKKDV